MDEYLPPVVTRLRADLSDLMTGLAQSRVAVMAWAAGIRDDVEDVLRNAGRQWSLAFSDSFDESTQEHLRTFERDIDQNFLPRAASSLARAGAESGMEFGTTFMAVARPLLIGLLITTLPLLTTMVGAAVSLGIGVAFIGLGAYLLREQPALIAAATSLRDTMSSVFKEAAMPMLGPLLAALGILERGVKELGPSFKEVFAGIAPGIPDLATGVVGMFREMMPGLKELAPVIGQLLSALGSVMPSIGEGLGDFFRSLAESGPAMVEMIINLGTNFGKLLTILGAIIKFFADIYLWLKNLRDMSVAGGWSTPWDAWATGLEKAWNWIKRVAGAIGDWFSGLISDVEGTGASLGSKLQGMVDRVAAFIDRLVERVKALPGQIMNFLEALPGRLGDLALRAFDGLMYWSGFAVVRILQFFDTLPERLTAIVFRAWNFVVERFRWGVSTAVAIARELPGQIWGFFQDMGTRTVAAVDALWANLQAWAQRTYDGMVQWAVSTVNDVDAWFRALPERIANSVDTLITRIKQFFAGAGDWLWDAGRNLIQGLVSGIMNAVDAAVAAIRRAMDRIRQGARDALGISSPSRVFAELGRNTMEGYEQGVQSRSESVRNTLRALVTPQATPALAALAAGTGASAQRPAGAEGSTGMAHFTLNIDGQRFIEAVIPAAQRRKNRTGTTGLS